MVLKSMTGYGRAEAEKQGRTWSVEVRSVNNRFLDAKVRVPRDYNNLEEPLRRIIGEFHQRGRVDMSIMVSGDFSDLMQVRVNTHLAQAYKQALKTLGEQVGAVGQIDLKLLAELPDVLIRDQRVEDSNELWPHLEAMVRRALRDGLDMRVREAQALTTDLTERLHQFSAVLDEIEATLPELIARRRDTLRERLDKLLQMIDVDPMRLAQEVAILADKMDVTEEMVRLRSHIDQFLALLQATEPIGRTLDFLIQEFLREVNTMASKINDAEIAHKIVLLKSELEKMREQVQNIE